jgi:primary-amine oxidase
MIATVANYEYCFYWNFYQDGTIELETRLTGILNVYTAAQGEVTPFGTLVAPQVQAHYHQHIFSLRLDPMVDGLRNSVVESDILPMEAPTSSVDNFAGNGFYQKKTVLTSAQEHGARSYDAEVDRRWTIVNNSRKHYASGNPVGYSLDVRGAATKLLAKPDSWIAKRAVFASKTLWVVRDDGDNKRMFPAGKYVPQTSVLHVFSCRLHFLSSTFLSLPSW